MSRLPFGFASRVCPREAFASVVPPVLPSRRTGKVRHQVLARVLEVGANRAEAEEEDAEGVLRACFAVRARALCARGLRHLRAEDDQKVEQNRSADLARVQALLVVAELDRALAVPEVVEVEGAVAVFVIVVGMRVVVAEPSRVDRVHRRGAETANLVDEGVVGLTRIPRDAGWLCSRRLEDQL